jgi:UDP-glucuronate decarboxylase
MRKKILENDILEIINNIKQDLHKINNKKILLVGYAGFLGIYFLKTFEKILNDYSIKFKVNCYDSFVSSNVKAFNFKTNKNIKLFKTGIGKKISSKYDYIINLAGIASPILYKKKPLETIESSYEVTKILLNKAKKDKSKFIYFSSSEIYGNPDKNNIPTKEKYYGYVNSFGPRSCYDEGKRIGESLCYVYSNYFNCNIKIIRPFNIFGPLMNKKDYRIIPNIINKIKNHKKILIYGNGNQTRSFCYITDAMTGFFRICFIPTKNKIFNIGNPNNEISIINLLKQFDKLRNKKHNKKILKHPSFYPGDEPQRRCPNIDLAKKELKYKPKINLKLGLERMLKFNNL